AAFIHVADLRQNRSERSKGMAPTPIEKLLFEGQPIMVQVIKDPLGSKGARLSTQISIAGRMLVHLPFDPHIGISQRIESEADRNRLRESATQSMTENETGGFIDRTQAEGATDEQLEADCAYLRKLWAGIQEKIKTQPAPSLLYSDLTLPQRVLRDMVTPNTSSILVDSRTVTQELIEWAHRYTPSVVERIRHYSGER